MTIMDRAPYAPLPPPLAACDNAAIMSFSFGAAGDGRMGASPLAPQPPASHEGFYAGAPDDNDEEDDSLAPLPAGFVAMRDPNSTDTRLLLAYHPSLGVVLDRARRVWIQSALYEPTTGFMIDRSSGIVRWTTGWAKPAPYPTILNANTRVKREYQAYFRKDPKTGLITRKTTRNAKEVVPADFRKSDETPVRPARLPDGYVVLPEAFATMTGYYVAYHPARGAVLDLLNSAWLTNMIFEPQRELLIETSTGIFIDKDIAASRADSVRLPREPGSILDDRGNNIKPEYAGTLVKDRDGTIRLKSGVGLAWAPPQGFKPRTLR
jgi:hypothetical protein